MIAIPINEKGEEPVISTIFAMSKWFAIVDGDTVMFEKNIYKNGLEVTQWLQSIGVKKVVANKIGSTTFETLNSFHIGCFHTEIKVKLTDILESIKKNKLPKLDINTSVFSKNCIHN